MFSGIFDIILDLEIMENGWNGRSWSVNIYLRIVVLLRLKYRNISSQHEAYGFDFLCALKSLPRFAL